MQIYLDGVSVGNVSIAAGAANSLTTINAFMIGANNSYASPGGFFNGAYQDFRFYNGKALSATEVKNWYNYYATKSLYNAQPEYYLPTLANVSAGALSNTGFEVVSGSFKVSEGSDKKKWIECVTAGVAPMLQTNAYGTYVFKVNHVGTSNTFILFASDTKGAEGATGQDCYTFLIDTAEQLAVRESVNGTPANKFVSAIGSVTPLTDYMFAISRSTTGVFTIYAKGGSEFPQWTQVTASTGSNPFTDTTTTTSQYLNLDFDAGDKFRLLGIHQGLLTISELSALYK
jgi:hypothetical protein